MQTNLADFMRGSVDGERASEIIGACVHCGFCSATCPTYQILGDERDSPRGRIYLIKQMLEGAPPGTSTQTHLDRCLTCRSCETTCPSGVKYGHLLDIGRKVAEQRVPRPWRQRLLRQVLVQVLPRRALLTPLLKIGYFLRPVLPEALQQKLPRLNGRLSGKPGGKPGGKLKGESSPSIQPSTQPPIQPPIQPSILPPTRPAGSHARRMLLLDGCAQPGLAPNINAATIRVFDALGVSVACAPKAACCGALRYHLNAQEAALDDMRRNIDAWWPYIIPTVAPATGSAPRSGAQAAVLPVEAILMTASGCGVTVKEYAYLLAHDPRYAEKAARVSALTRDVGEVLAEFGGQLQEKIADRNRRQGGQTRQDGLPRVLAYHPPCTLQHGQQLRGQVEGLLRGLGFEVRLPQDSHLCCGSAGTYSLLQPALSGILREKKLANLQALAPDAIASGNIGCLAHLQSGTELPVRHWIEWVDLLLG